MTKEKGPLFYSCTEIQRWSYLYRNVIKGLRGECRLIAPDYPGFGMSRAPSHYGFKPQEHSEMLLHFIKQLDLKNFVIVVQDWGGPIGMSYVVEHPEKHPRPRPDEHLGVAFDAGQGEVVLARDGRMADRVLASN